MRIHFSAYRSAMSVSALVVLGSGGATAQGARADYERAERFLRPQVSDLVLNERAAPNWIEDTDHFWYRRHDRLGST